jgi:hypothetical protein
VKSAFLRSVGLQLVPPGAQYCIPGDGCVDIACIVVNLLLADFWLADCLLIAALYFSN